MQKCEFYCDIIFEVNRGWQIVAVGGSVIIGCEFYFEFAIYADIESMSSKNIVKLNEDLFDFFSLAGLSVVSDQSKFFSRSFIIVGV